MSRMTCGAIMSTMLGMCKPVLWESEHVVTLDHVGLARQRGTLAGPPDWAQEVGLAGIYMSLACGLTRMPWCLVVHV